MYLNRSETIDILHLFFILYSILFSSPLYPISYLYSCRLSLLTEYCALSSFLSLSQISYFQPLLLSIAISSTESLLLNTYGLSSYMGTASPRPLLLLFFSNRSRDRHTTCEPVSALGVLRFPPDFSYIPLCTLFDCPIFPNQ